jgi:hypothetical protein
LASQSSVLADAPPHLGLTSSSSPLPLILAWSRNPYGLHRRQIP